MTVNEVLRELKSLGSPATKKVLMNHGAPEPLFGVKIGDLKKLQKRLKTNYQLALDLYDTGNGDAMYLAGLIADDAQMTKKDLEHWVKQATWHLISGTTVPSVAAQGRFGHELALKWMTSKKEPIAVAGWATYSLLIAIKPNQEFDPSELQALLKQVRETIHKQPNYVRYVMNGFVISVGAYLPELTETAIQTAEAIGVVSVDTGKTACKVPDAAEYIRKVQAHGTLGKKRKSAKC